jgi:hypothetical protein
MKRITIFLVVALAAIHVFAQSADPTLISRTEFPLLGSVDDLARSFAMDAEGNYYVLVDGLEDCSGMVKLSRTGDTLWRRTDPPGSFAGYESIKYIPGENVIVRSFGTRLSPTSFGSIIEKIAPDGAIVWQTRDSLGSADITSYGDTIVAVHPAHTGMAASALLIDPSGKAVRSFPIVDQSDGVLTPRVLGNALWVSGTLPYGSYVNSSGYEAKYDLGTGRELWRRYEVDAVRVAMDVDADGYAFLGGSVSVRDSLGALRYFLVKYDPDGNEVWREEWWGYTAHYVGMHPGNYVNGVCVSSLGSRERQVVLLGQADNSSATSSYYATCFRAQDGMPTWILYSAYHSSPSYSEFNAALFDRENNLLLLGDAYIIGSTSPNSGYIDRYSVAPAAVREVPGAVPAAFQLFPNYPNPFNPSTIIRFEVPNAAQVRLEVYNLLGARVAVLHEGRLTAGTYESRFDGSNLPSGVYVYRLTGGGATATRKMLLLK